MAIHHDEQEQRRFTRIPFEGKVHLQRDGQQWSSELLDISLKGALVALPHRFSGHAGETFDLTIHLNDSDTRIGMSGELAHVTDNTLGFHCRHIDIDSITHLRRLLELNLGDSRLLDRELGALG